MIRILIILTALMLTTPAMAQSVPLKVELAYDRVDITTGFNGTRVVLFGTSPVESGNLAVTLKGPEKTVIMRRKGRVLGAWMNKSSVEFRRVPSYYDYAATTDDDLLGDAALLKDNGIGIDNLDFYPEDDEDAAIANTFREALIRNMQTKGFYPLKSHELQLTDPKLFKVTFDLPPGVPTGIYTVDTMLIIGGKVQAKESRTFQVGQVGFNAKVYMFANDASLFYGVFAVMIAAITGWGAFTFLRRD